MFDLAADAGVANLVNFEFRRHPARRELRRLLRDGVAGTVEHLQWNAFHGVWRDPARPYGWSFDAALGGGWIRLSGSHTIDYVRWTLGEMVDATGTMRITIVERADRDGKLQRCTAEDGYTALLQDRRRRVGHDRRDVDESGGATEPGHRDRQRRRARARQRESTGRGRADRLYGRWRRKELFAFEQGDTYMRADARMGGHRQGLGAAGSGRPRRADVRRWTRVLAGHGSTGARRHASIGRSSEAGAHMTVVRVDAAAIADRLAIIDLVNGYFAATDAKRWDAVEDFYTDDAVVWCNPERSNDGPHGDRRLHALDARHRRHRHLPPHGSFTPVIDGDTADAPVRVRAMHTVWVRRAGRFWESLAIQHSPLRAHRGRLALHGLRMEGRGRPRQPGSLRGAAARHLSLRGSAEQPWRWRSHDRDRSVPARRQGGDRHGRWRRHRPGLRTGARRRRCRRRARRHQRRQRRARRGRGPRRRRVRPWESTSTSPIASPRSRWPTRRRGSSEASTSS